MVRLMKRRRETPSKECSTQHPPEFFKIYLPEHNSKQLVIPPAFINNFNGRIPSKVVLKSLQGKDWNIELEHDERKLLMKKGWDRFVIDNSLERGEFLIFSYSGNTVFIVKIFSINGCVKEESKNIDDHSYMNVEEESNLDHEFSPSLSFKKGMLLEPIEVSDDLSEAMPEVVQERTVQSKNIRFSKFIDGRGYVHIPAAVLRENNVKLPRPTKEVLFRYKRVSQVAKVVQTTRRRVRFSTGWKDFQRKCKIVEGDECEFDIVLGNDRQIKEVVLLRICSNTRQ
ncbi:putative B3 domain-containing protein Os03g0621600 [Amaranthus tricolor]|uniref:putative B3 domain-containing protein Os03g0621600 n=1 Tax=Amaranthus tricolor TaxID=29722 RepID=UPI00258B4365|nr:putative B3 domain-containing protein Os03g0621600 [Amaranthus tricolor]XP_057515095.1 putative B3 domain-containing protein Os03g0621600 [Amaranthus tricolor]